MSQTCPYDLQKPVLRVPTGTSDRMSQWFPMNNIRVVLANWIITCALAACIKWKLLLLEISTSICSPRCALTTVHQSFLCLWDSITGPHEEFLTKSIPVCLCLLTKFVGTCSERIQLPFSHCSSVLLWDASKNASCGPAVSYPGSV